MDEPLQDAWPAKLEQARAFSRDLGFMHAAYYQGLIEGGVPIEQAHLPLTAYISASVDKMPAETQD